VGGACCVGAWCWVEGSCCAGAECCCEGGRPAGGAYDVFDE